MTDIRTLTPAQLYDDMSERFGKELFTTIWGTQHVNVKMRHNPTNTVVEALRFPSAFKAKREAYAQLVEKLYPVQALIIPQSDDERAIVADLVFGHDPAINGLADLRASATRLITAHRALRQREMAAMRRSQLAESTP